MKRFIAMLVAAGVLAAPAKAGDWFKIDQLEATGKADAKEVKVEHKIAKVRVVCTEGSVIINTIVVRHHGKAEPHKVAQRLEKGEKVAIELTSDDSLLVVDGLRISDDGRGKYKIEARK